MPQIKANPQGKPNYQLVLDNTLKEIVSNGERPRLLLHSCCGPCSSYVLEYLAEYFDITVFYCNPCISPLEEYEHRKDVQKDLIKKMNEQISEHKDILGVSRGETHIINFIEDEYDHDSFLKLVKGHEEDSECGERCHICYRQRLERAAEVAKKGGYDYFTTTLTVSPYKCCYVINDIGTYLESRCGVKYLASDFKKREGYKRSIELSKVYGLYRQDYCGCEFSIRNDI